MIGLEIQNGLNGVGYWHKRKMIADIIRDAIKKLISLTCDFGDEIRLRGKVCNDPDF